jgi:transcriptional regulator with XRE-family HTH domain
MSETNNNDAVREKILLLIESEYESDAAFERANGIADKTVNNWRRGRSSSYMKMLPFLANCFKVNITELLSLEPTKDTSELSDDERQLLQLYRRSRHIPAKMRKALKQTIETTINLYIESANEVKSSKTKKKSAM